MKWGPYNGVLAYSDYVYLLRAQCDRWDVDLNDGKRSLAKHHMALRALVFKILYDSGFTYSNIALGSLHDYKTVCRLIKNCNWYEARLVAWRDNTKKPTKAERYARFKATKPQVILRGHSHARTISPSASGADDAVQKEGPC